MGVPGEAIKPIWARLRRPYQENRHFAYPTAKGGVISLTKSVATILGPHKIRANTIIPGFVQKGPRLCPKSRFCR
jgi:NAD(P)-dependent dehydrogenase (short-subunit alcohol dehydrogenase family)